MRLDTTERDIYACICSGSGIRAKEIAKMLDISRQTVNHYLYASPFMKELCWQDKDSCWHGLIRQGIPHTGIGYFSGFYGRAADFRSLTEEAFMERIEEGCREIGRNLNDTRGLLHSFRDARKTMLGLFDDLEAFDRQNPFSLDGGEDKYFDDWEILFELRIKKSRMLRIYADVLVITPTHAFSLEFKMKDTIDPDEVMQAAKYCPYLEVLFGPTVDVIGALVLTKASDLFTMTPIPGTQGELPVCSGDMLFNLFDAYLGIGLS